MLNVIAREMVAIKRSFLLINLELSHHVYPEKNGRKCFTTTSAKKKESSENPRSQEQPLFPLRAPKNLLSQSAVAVFGLGFIDAGYSGDWSRIGVISKESEDLLKVRQELRRGGDNVWDLYGSCKRCHALEVVSIHHGVPSMKNGRVNLLP